MSDQDEVVLTRSVLDAQGCDTPDCGHDHTTLYMVASCHPQAGLLVAYDKTDGTMLLACTECEAFVGRIAVARSIHDA